MPGGIPLERFCTPPPRALLCPTCHLVFRDPWRACKEDHVFCQSCSGFPSDAFVEADGYTVDHGCRTCDITTSRGGWSESSMFLFRAVGELEVYCSRRDLGCSWTGPLVSESAHLESQCSRRLLTCPNEHCGIELPQHELHDHRYKTCAYQKIRCPRELEHSGTGKAKTSSRKCVFLRKDREAHDALCEFWSCPIDSCPTIGTLTMLNTHSPYCASLHAKLEASPRPKDLSRLELMVQYLTWSHEEQIEELEEYHEFHLEVLEEEHEADLEEAWTIAGGLEEELDLARDKIKEMEDEVAKLKGKMLSMALFEKLERRDATIAFLLRRVGRRDRTIAKLETRAKGKRADSQGSDGSGEQSMVKTEEQSPVNLEQAQMVGGKKREREEEEEEELVKQRREEMRSRYDAWSAKRSK